jgi:hypothetical protein
MEVRLTHDQKAFMKQAIESRRLSCAEDAVEEALSLWEERSARVRRFSRLLMLRKPR